MLNKRLASLALPLPTKDNGSSVSSRISGKTFVFESNDKHLKEMNLLFIDSLCLVTMKIESSDYNFSFGSGKWITGETSMPGPNLLLNAKAHHVGLPADIVTGSFGWKDDNTIELVLRYIESPHTETIDCKFDKDKISVAFHSSNMPGNVPPEMKGHIR